MFDDVLSVYLIFLLVIVSTFGLISILLNELIKSKNRQRTEKIKDQVIEVNCLKNEKSFSEATKNIPRDISADDFFDRLRKELSSAAYIQMKNAGSSTEDRVIYRLLKLHHEQALQQSKIQFWFSLFSAIAGFVFIIVMIALASNNAWYEYIFKILPGTIVEIVSVLFFNQARETRDRATKFFKELNYENQISKSVSIADSIEDDDIKSKVKAQIALHIIGINDSNKEINIDTEKKQ